MLDPVESAISAACTDWVEGYEVTHSSHDQVRGTFLGQEGIVYSFKIDPQGVEFQESRQDTAEFNDYFLAQLHSAGADYHGDSAYAYWQGLVGADVRMDRKASVCKPGNVSCSGQCLPRGRKCRSQGGSLKQRGKMRQASGSPDQETGNEDEVKRSTATGALIGTLVGGLPGTAVGSGIGYARAKAKQGKKKHTIAGLAAGLLSGSTLVATKVAALEQDKKHREKYNY